MLSTSEFFTALASVDTDATISIMLITPAITMIMMAGLLSVQLAYWVGSTIAKVSTIIQRKMMLAHRAIKAGIDAFMQTMSQDVQCEPNHITHPVSSVMCRLDVITECTGPIYKRTGKRFERLKTAFA